MINSDIAVDKMVTLSLRCGEIVVVLMVVQYVCSYTDPGVMWVIMGYVCCTGADIINNEIVVEIIGILPLMW